MLSQYVIMFSSHIKRREGRRHTRASRMAVWVLGVAMLALPAAGDEQTERNEILKVVATFLTSWELNNSTAFAAALHEDAVFAYPGGRLDKKQAVAMFENYQSEKRDIRIYLWDHVFVDGDRFATAYQFAATDRDSQRRQAVGTGVVGRVKDGRIILIKEYFDEQVAVLQYQGRLPLDEGQVAPWPMSVWLRPETID